MSEYYDSHEEGGLPRRAKKRSRSRRNHEDEQEQKPKKNHGYQNRFDVSGAVTSWPRFCWLLLDWLSWQWVGTSFYLAKTANVSDLRVSSQDHYRYLWQGWSGGRDTVWSRDLCGVGCHFWLFRAGCHRNGRPFLLWKLRHQLPADHSSYTHAGPLRRVPTLTQQLAKNAF